MEAKLGKLPATLSAQSRRGTHNLFRIPPGKMVKTKTNVGGYGFDVLGEKAQLVVWDRVKPDPELLRTIDEGSVALLYPSADSQLVSTTTDYQNYIIIDGTWQQAQKIYNRSPYLKALPAVKIPVNKPSAYHLRRNQRAGCLCTAECAIELLKAKGFSVLADELQLTFLKRMAVQ